MICIQGLFRSPRSLHRIQHAVHEKCGFNVVDFVYDARRTSLDEQAEALGKLMKEYQSVRLASYHMSDGVRLSALLVLLPPLQRSGMRACHFITHGSGALVLRASMKHVSWEGVPSKAVLIAPCNRG